MAGTEVDFKVKAGMVVNGTLNMSDNSITNVGGIALDQITADGTTITLKPDDNQAAAFTITDAGSAVFMKVDYWYYTQINNWR